MFGPPSNPTGGKPACLEILCEETARQSPAELEKWIISQLFQRHDLHARAHGPMVVHRDAWSSGTAGHLQHDRRVSPHADREGSSPASARIRPDASRVSEWRPRRLPAWRQRLVIGRCRLVDQCGSEVDVGRKWSDKNFLTTLE